MGGGGLEASEAFSLGDTGSVSSAERSALKNGMQLSEWHRMHHSNAGKWQHVQNFYRVNFLDKAIELKS